MERCERKPNWELEIKLLSMQVSSRKLKTSRSRILLGIERREIGRYLEGTEDGGEVLELEFLKSEGKVLHTDEGRFENNIAEEG